MRAALVALLLLGSPPAFAMGTNVSIELVAWNADGTAALLHTHTSIDGGTTDSYSVIVAGDQQQLAVQIAGTARLDGQTVDPTTCTKAMAALTTSIAAHKFAGVTVRSDRCGLDKRDDAVVTSPSVTTAAKTSIIGKPGKTPRDKKIWAAFKNATGVDIAVKRDANTDYPTADIATKNGELVIALLSPSRGSPASTELLAFVPAKDGFVPLALVF